MNKQIAKEKLDKVREYLGRYCNVTVMSRGLIYDLGNIINFLDDLELYEPKKVVVPQWFADWIEDCPVKDKGQVVYDVWFNYENDYFTKEQDNWLQDNKELATRAILDGYVVEKEPLYYVQFAGDCILFQADDEFWVESMENMDSDCTTKHKFTEAEIKAKGERYWLFAVKVED